MRQTCRTCYYCHWLTDDFGGDNDNLIDGWCRRYPPVRACRVEAIEPASYDECHHPVTLHHHWCGEWSAVGIGAAYRPMPGDDDANLSGGDHA